MPDVVGHQEGHLLFGDQFSGDDEVALIFTVLFIDHHDHLASSQRFDTSLDRLGELDGGHGICSHRLYVLDVAANRRSWLAWNTSGEASGSAWSE